MMSKIMDLKKYNTSTLKQVSIDDENNEYMTECEKIKVINFDSFGTKYFGKKIRKLNIKLKTNDALFLHEDGRYTFIEFKNIDFQLNKKNKISIEKLRDLEGKIVGSIFILLDITKMNFNEVKEKVDYILVYSREKNSISGIAELIINQAEKEEKSIDFGLEKFKGYCFKNVYTYSKQEFEKNFVEKHENS